MNLAATALLHVLLCALCAAGVWIVYKRTDNASWIDSAWAAMIGAGALLHGATAAPRSFWGWLLPALVAAWSIRLTFHLARRTYGEPEDGRYKALRDKWTGRHGPEALDRRMLVFYLAQALLAAALAIPAGISARNPDTSWTASSITAIALGVLALAGAHLSDSQLHRFRSNPANRARTCRDGLWNLSRHPNYLFEILLWISFALGASSAPHGAWAWLAPASIAFFLIRVTGIPLTEAQALRTRGEDYRSYQREVPALLPRFFPKETPR
ncbi:MAG: DUF1295 domain-containing protein [Fibrobacteria bacterium]|nr:DUF1295 domain-containing protein [Fibrobacteria bacterium]